MKLSKILLGLLFTCSSFVFGQNSYKSVPHISVQTINGEKIDFSSVIDSGKITVISFWATWCGPCIKELQAIDPYYNIMDGDDFSEESWAKKYDMKFVAVSMDDARNVRKVKPKVTGEGWAYEIILDVNQDLARGMNCNNPPMTFIVNQKGEIVYEHQGYTPGAEEDLEELLEQVHETGYTNED
ncbi:MAG: TlpA family protein disulfide reductase [Bacteroidia bacterium]